MLGVIFGTSDGRFMFYCKEYTRSYISYFRWHDRIWTVSDWWCWLELRCVECDASRIYQDHNTLFPEGFPENKTPLLKDFKDS